MFIKRNIAIVIATIGVLAGCEKDITIYDDWGLAAVIVRGEVRTSDGSPIAGASILTRIESLNPDCQPLQLYPGATPSYKTGGDGRFSFQELKPPSSTYSSCVSVYVRAPQGSGLADTAIHNLRVTMRPEGAPQRDTLSMGSIVMRRN